MAREVAIEVTYECLKQLPLDRLIQGSHFCD